MTRRRRAALPRRKGRAAAPGGAGTPLTPSAKVRASLLFDEETKFGQGRAELLRRIAGTGSLRKAVLGLGMSYRAAWGYLRELESACGRALVEPAGKGPRAGMRLTADGEDLLARYDAFRQAVESAAAAAFAHAFPEASGRVPKTRRTAADFRAPPQDDA